MDKNLAREKKKRLIITFETTTAPLKLDIKGKACGIPGRFMKEHDIRWEAMYEIEMR